MHYKACWDLQESLFSARMNSKLEGSPSEDGFIGDLLFVEHPHVFTIGKSGKDENLLISEQQLQGKGAEFFHINRGGDITYHGPGQIVGYPIFDIDALGLGVRNYVFNLEEVIIRTLKQFSIHAERLEGAAGVWIEPQKKDKSRKICAIGVRASRGVTMHGFAFNINTDLSFYNLINPCGFTDRGVSSLEKELGEPQDIERVKQVLRAEFEHVFNIRFKAVE